MVDLTEIEILKHQLEEQNHRIDALQITLSWALSHLQDQGIAEAQWFLSRQANELDGPASEVLVAEFDALAENVAFLAERLRNSQEK
ncbi:MAG: hypothetical protein ACRBB6_02895 [Neptuniibacter sp.]